VSDDEIMDAQGLKFGEETFEETDKKVKKKVHGNITVMNIDGNHMASSEKKGDLEPGLDNLRLTSQY